MIKRIFCTALIGFLTPQIFCADGDVDGVPSLGDLDVGVGGSLLAKSMGSSVSLEILDPMKAEPRILAQRLSSIGVTAANVDFITNDTLGTCFFSKTLSLKGVRARAAEGFRQLAAPPVPGALSAEARADYFKFEDKVDGLKAGTHAVINLGEHNLDIDKLAGLKSGTHVISDRAALAVAKAERDLAQRNLQEMVNIATMFKRAAAQTYKLVPVGSRPQHLREAYAEITDQEAFVIVSAIRVPLQPKTDADANAGAPVDAATFLAALNGDAPIATMDVGRTVAALQTAAGNPLAELEALIAKYAGLM